MSIQSFRKFLEEEGRKSDRLNDLLDTYEDDKSKMSRDELYELIEFGINDRSKVEVVMLTRQKSPIFANYYNDYK